MRPIFAAILLAILAGLAVFFSFFFRPKFTVSVDPATANVTFGGQTATGSRAFTVMPGLHELSVELPGYIPLKRTERLTVGQRRSITIKLKLVPEPTPLTTESVLLVGLSSDGESALYVGNTGKTLFTREAGEQRALTPDSFNRPSVFRLSPTQDVVLLENPNGDVFLHDFKRYNLVEQEQFLYGRDIGEFDWVNPTGEKILYTYAPASGERSLVLADRTNRVLERVVNLQEAGITNPTVSVAVDGKTAVLISRPGEDFTSYHLFLFDLFTKRAKQLTTDGGKVDALLAPTGSRILFTRFEQDPDSINNQLLSVMDLDGRNRKDFNLRATLDDVAFLNDTTILVAVSSKEGSRLTRLDLATGEEEPYFIQFPGPLFIGKVILSADKKSVYLTGSSQVREQYGTLYEVTLETDEYE